MTAHLPVPVRPNDELHPLVYRAMIGLTIWLVLSVWALFDRGSYVGLNLAIVTLFFLIFVALPTTLWLAWRRNADPNEQHSYVTPFREWISHPFVTWTGGISGPRSSDANPVANRRGRLRHDHLRASVFICGTATCLNVRQFAKVCVGTRPSPQSLGTGTADFATMWVAD
jgi:hypothetical protein